MESVRRHRCETCAFHEAGDSPCTGRCLNTSWQPSSGVQRVVRARECACYGGMGIDFWRPLPDDDGTDGPDGGSIGGPGIGPTLAGGRVIALVPRGQFERFAPSRAQLMRDRNQPAKHAAIVDEVETANDQPQR